VLKSDFTPLDQLGVRLTEWITGKPMVENRMFRHMTPLSDDVIELKTDDLRIFGWLYQAGIRMTWTALPMTSAFRFWPWGPLGMKSFLPGGLASGFDTGKLISKLGDLLILIRP